LEGDLPMIRNSAARSRVASLAFVLSALFGADAQAIVISYEATDLVDVTLGEDLWSYTYRVTGAAFAGGEGFSIFFDPALYGSIEASPPAVNGDWDVLTTQPSTSLPAPGIYDALALIDGPSLADPFKVSFVWLGSGTPGAQSFDRYDAGFTTVASGTTTPTVPEPGTLPLMLAALGVLGLGKVWTSRQVT